MDVYVNGDFVLDNCGYPEEVCSIDEACQRVRFILLTKKGGFIYNRELGADFSSILSGGYSEGDGNKLAELLCREALAEQEEISVENVTLQHSGGKYHLKFKVLFDGREKSVEVDLN